MIQERTSGEGAASAMAVVGGILAVVGSVLNWAKASAGAFTASAKGLEGWEGKVTILGGVLLLVAGISSLVGSAGAKNRLRVTALIAGAGAAGVGIYTALTAKDQIIEGAASEIAKQLGVAVSIARAAVQEAIDSGQIKVSLEIGIYLVVAGGILGVLAALLAMTSSRAAPQTPGVPGSGAGLTGWSAPSMQPPSAPSVASPWATGVPPTPAPPAPEEERSGVIPPDESGSTPP